ncbi:hypothetical protein PFNF54_00087 [Plasmodium falciparum NF54]|uniref:RRM domain-containing protein n=1 Tax=Plasmodium falciparum (isolate NF54) TaxID=5843 RepID=W7K1E4_PLAFO|nr:hypothetical protein PFNF54_00087 [Plasmodium falciparum NF54]
MYTYYHSYLISYLYILIKFKKLAILKILPNWKIEHKNVHGNYEERNNEIRVKISNLDYTISKNDLMELFSNVCKVVNAWINYDHTDRSNGTAVCVFENINDAQKAIDKYDGSEIEGL